MSRIALLSLVVASVAHAAPVERVLLADPDPELLHAVTTSLAPWKLAVVVERVAPTDDTSAHARAEELGARFVVWREGNELVVFDRARDTSERRSVRDGNLDAVTAAGAALTVKTMMRLPPPDEDGAATRPPRDRMGVRLEIGVGASVAAAGDEGTGGRAAIAAMVRPRVRWPWRFGVRADIGTASSIDTAGFKGHWSDWALLAAASGTYTRGPWEIEPWIGAGVARGTLDGTEMAMARTESTTMLTLRGGAYLRRRVSAMTAGLSFELVGTPGAPTYTRTTPGMGTPDVFEASAVSVVVGFALAVDLGR